MTLLRHHFLSSAFIACTPALTLYATHPTGLSLTRPGEAGRRGRRQQAVWGHLLVAGVWTASAPSTTREETFLGGAPPASRSSSSSRSSRSSIGGIEDVGSLDFDYHLLMPDDNDDGGTMSSSTTTEESRRRDPSPPPSAYHDATTSPPRRPPPSSATPVTTDTQQDQDLEAGWGMKQELRQRGGPGGGLERHGSGSHHHGHHLASSHHPSGGRVTVKPEREMRALLSFEWALMKRGVPPSKSPLFFLLLWMFVEYVHLTAHNYVYYLEGKLWGAEGPPPPMQDLGLMLLADRLPERYEWIIGFATAFLCGLMFSLGLLRLTLTNVNWGGPSIEVRTSDGRLKTMLPMPVCLVMQRACQAMSVGMSLRILTFLVTLIPNPAEYCHGSNWDPPAHVAQIFTRIKFTGSCGDLLFSGHTSHGMVLTLVMCRFVPNVKAAKALAVMSMTLLAASLLAFKAHYSSDVLVATYVNIMIWRLLPMDPPRVNLADLQLDDHLPLPAAPAYLASSTSSSSSSPSSSDGGGGGGVVAAVSTGSLCQEEKGEGGGENGGGENGGERRGRRREKEGPTIVVQEQEEQGQQQQQLQQEEVWRRVEEGQA